MLLTNLIAIYIVTDVTGLLDEGRVVDAVYFDFCKAFHTISHVIIDKQTKCGLDMQRVVVSHMKSN